MRPARWHGILALACAVILAPGCKRAPDYVGKCVVVFLDRSASVKSDASVYESAFRVICGSLRPGDRIVVGNITAESSRDFRAFIDQTVPNDMAGVRRLLEADEDYKRKLADSKSHASAAIDSIQRSVAAFLAAPSDSPLTAIIEATHIARQVFAGEHRRAVLVILSDMVEESDVLDMTKDAFQSSPAESSLDGIMATRLVPDLANVEVYVAGATPGGSVEAQKIAEFWRRYFDAANARMVDGNYARHLHSFVDSPEN